jgi:hypothetical protein
MFQAKPTPRFNIEYTGTPASTKAEIPARIMRTVFFAHVNTHGSTPPSININDKTYDILGIIN